MRRVGLGLLLLVAVALPAVPAWADAGQLLSLKLIRTRKNWDVLAVLSHAGEGERFGLDSWSVTTDRGERLQRVHLSKPRSSPTTYESWMTDVPIPPGTKSLTVRLHDRVHGYEGHKPFVIDLSTPKGSGYEIVEEDKPLPYRRYHGSHVKRLMRRNGDYTPYVW